MIDFEHIRRGCECASNADGGEGHSGRWVDLLTTTTDAIDMNGHSKQLGVASVAADAESLIHPITAPWPFDV